MTITKDNPEVSENPMPTGLARMDAPGGALARTGPAKIMDLIEHMVRAGVTTDTVAALEKMQAMYREEEKQDAKRQWLRAYGQAKEHLRTIIGTKIVPTKTGGIMYRTAPLEDILDGVEPIIQPFGLRLRFDSHRDGNILEVSCCVIHDDGHEEVTHAYINCANTDNKGGDTGFFTLGMRKSVLAAFALAVRGDDEDARVLGGFIHADQLKALQDAFHAAGDVDEKKFLDFAGATDWTNIRLGKLSQLHDFLRLRGKGNAAPVAPPPAPEPAKPTEKPPAPARLTAQELVAQVQAWIDANNVAGAKPAKDLLVAARKHLNLGQPGASLTQDQMRDLLQEATSGNWDLTTATPKA
jgi:hypothetical protein